ncbi:dephospho-CoA kinase [Sporomusa aerivorans]|uniref:dephospho-CoA kinase n=1 Tax=Sporomusa aerivorans TaxID=204936 RepID=UPI00352B81CF
MIVIGLTGGIASGKSTVSTMLRELGAYIVDADKLSREVTLPGRPAWQEIIDNFGAEILEPNGQINRKCLGQIIFTDSQARALLGCITHPRIEAEAMAAIDHARQNGYERAVLDAPLLIEVGWHVKVDAVWVVFVDKKTQLARLIDRDKLSCEEAISRINAQLSLEEKLKYADIVINNSETKEKTQEQVARAWQQMGAITPAVK